MRVPGGRNRGTTKLQRRRKAFDEAVGTDDGDGKRKWFTTVGHQKLVCYHRPGSNK